MFKWIFLILIFATICSGKYQNKEKPLKRQRKLGLDLTVTCFCHKVKSVFVDGSTKLHKSMLHGGIRAEFMNILSRHLTITLHTLSLGKQRILSY